VEVEKIARKCHDKQYSVLLRHQRELEKVTRPYHWGIIIDTYRMFVFGSILYYAMTTGTGSSSAL
jgi:hypothetical protein